MKLRLVPTNSISLAGIGYEPGHTGFYAQFARGGDIYYYDVGQDAAEVVTDILFDPESQGKAFAEFKKVGLPHRKLTLEELEGMEFHV